MFQAMILSTAGLQPQIAGLKKDKY